MIIARTEDVWTRFSLRMLAEKPVSSAPYYTLPLWTSKRPTILSTGWPCWGSWRRGYVCLETEKAYGMVFVEYEITARVRQWYVLAPVLFNQFFDAVFAATVCAHPAWVWKRDGVQFG